MRDYVVRFWKRLLDRKLKVKEDIDLLLTNGIITPEEHGVITA